MRKTVPFYDVIIVNDPLMSLNSWPYYLFLSGRAFSCNASELVANTSEDKKAWLKLLTLGDLTTAPTETTFHFFSRFVFPYFFKCKFLFFCCHLWMDGLDVQPDEKQTNIFQTNFLPHSYFSVQLLLSLISRCLLIFWNISALDRVWVSSPVQVWSVFITIHSTPTRNYSH